MLRYAYDKNYPGGKKMAMNVMELNSQKKAERIIHAGRKTHRMHWQKMYGTDSTGGLTVKYLVFYLQKEA